MTSNASSSAGSFEAHPLPVLSSLCLAISEHAPSPMAMVAGASHVVRYVNPAFCRMMGKTTEQLIGGPLYAPMSEEDSCVKLLERVFDTGKSESFTEEETSKTHSAFWSYAMWPVLANELLVGVMIQVTETAAFHVKTIAMNEALVLGSLRQHELTEAAENLNAQLQMEIVARKKAAKELNEKARLVDLSNDGVIVSDIDDRISFWNKGAEKLYGWSYGEVLGKHLHDLLPTQFPMPMAEIIAQLQAEGQFTGEVLQIARDGRLVPSLARWVLDRDTHSILASYTDISERKHFEEQRHAHLLSEQASRMEAEAANRSKDVFLATLSHEVRTPLNAILGWATILRSGKCNAADLDEGMEVIERNCHAQAQLIDDVLDISRIVSGKLRLQLRPAELTEVIKAAIDVVHPAAAAKGVHILTDLDQAASHVWCDANRLQQVVWNLLTNAVKFTPTGRTVRIALTRERSTARIQVSDEGQGISPEFLPHVFERFRQADSSTKRKFGGLGLGLSIVRHIVEMHGGIVEAESAGEGHGATFTVNLPVRAVRLQESDPDAKDKSDNLAALHPMRARLDGLRVLVVDDEADARRLLGKVLGEAGAIVTVVGSVTEALAALSSANPQVLVSDIAMPDQDGYDLIRKVRGSGLTAHELPAVALTAFTHEEDRQRALLAGFQVHVPKPIDPHDLTAVIATLAGRTD